MKKIDFTKLEVKKSIDSTETIVIDVSKHFANVIYECTNGIEAHALAFKILQAKGPVELTEQEEYIAREAANRQCTPKFIDAVQTALNEKDNG